MAVIVVGHNDVFSCSEHSGFGYGGRCPPMSVLSETCTHEPVQGIRVVPRKNGLSDGVSGYEHSRILPKPLRGRGRGVYIHIVRTTLLVIWYCRGCCLNERLYYCL